MSKRNVIGCMTGTSMDAVDAALVSIEGHGLDMHATVRRCASRPLGELAERLREVADLQPVPANELATLMRDFALAHLPAIEDVAGDTRIDLIALHGQTVYHAPPASWQMINPAPIAEAVKSPVVYDMRAADIAAGGQGAPITPLADHVLFAQDNLNQIVINLGGFTNYTMLQGKEIAEIRGGDICACNQLLDAIARTCFNAPYDEDGKHAASGQVKETVKNQLAEILNTQATAGRSLGTGDELANWITSNQQCCPGEDLARSACQAIATVIAKTLQSTGNTTTEHRIDRILLAGGGAKNPILRKAIENHCNSPVHLSNDFGVDIGYREAIAMAVLGAMCQDEVPITLPQVTGVDAPAPVAGVWTGLHYAMQ